MVRGTDKAIGRGKWEVVWVRGLHKGSLERECGEGNRVDKRNKGRSA